MVMPIGRVNPIGECGHELAYGSRHAKICRACYDAKRLAGRKWTKTKEGRGRSKTKFLTLTGTGETKHITEWAVTWKCHVTLIARYLRWGLTVDEAAEKITTGQTARFHPWRRKVKPVSTAEYNQIMQAKRSARDEQVTKI